MIAEPPLRVRPKENLLYFLAAAPCHASLTVGKSAVCLGISRFQVKWHPFAATLNPSTYLGTLLVSKHISTIKQMELECGHPTLMEALLGTFHFR